MTLETKRLAFDLEVKMDDDARTFEGWASIFGNVDAGNDVVMPGAFSKTLSKRKASDKVVLLWQHDTKEPIGVWHDLQEIDKGLYGKAEIFDTSCGNDAYKLLKGGAVKGLSIGYGTKRYEIDKDKGTRKLTELELYEVSLVTFPMNDKAQVTRVKSLDVVQIENLHEHKRVIEAALRDAGASNSVAEYLGALIPTPALGDPEGEAKTAQKLAQLLNQFKL